MIVKVTTTTATRVAKTPREEHPAILEIRGLQAQGSLRSQRKWRKIHAYVFV
jgi:hypothetical protein